MPRLKKDKSKAIPAKVVEIKKPQRPMIVCDNCQTVLGEKEDFPKRFDCPQCGWTYNND
jgi:hypothetical protein